MNRGNQDPAIIRNPHPSSSSHQAPQRSSTLSRRYVKHPTQSIPVISSIGKNQPDSLARRQALAEEINRKNLEQIRESQLKSHPHIQSRRRLQPQALKTPIVQIQKSNQPTVSRLTPKERKEQAIAAALKNLEQQQPPTPPTEKTSSSKSKKISKKVILAFTTATACTLSLAYFVHLNLPDLSVRVAAIQTGIDAVYPTVPKDYQLIRVYSETPHKIVMGFSGPNQKTFKLSESKSSWDSSALLHNFVEPNWSNHYQTLREQGITIYTSVFGAVWVNGGIFYQIENPGGSLSRNQIKNIALSL